MIENSSDVPADAARVSIDLTRSDGSQRPLLPDFLPTLLRRAGIDARVLSPDDEGVPDYNSGMRIVASTNATRDYLAAALRNLEFRVVE